MDEEKNREQVPEQQSPPDPPTPRSTRIVAWVGVIFMVLLVILYSYSIATGAFLDW